ncbi:hypothetical protein MSAN_01813000 [Mycena sanguinolenta]|uniref:Uncharacterized protein n=1 Tax=Mycena sanguinolenta TaxID=230812 RepID=A0A8H6XUP3_9AGAR|nr:hypothetical protein MSAN_01813000 [Mycena sanguinolenta]
MAEPDSSTARLAPSAIYPNNISGVGLQDPYNYVLPPVVEAVRQGWETTLRAGLILSASLTVSSLLLFIAISLSPAGGNSAAHAALEAFSYGSIIFNAGGAIGAFVLLDMLGDLALTASRGSLPSSPEDRPPEKSVVILRNHGVRRSWNLMMLHWAFISHTGMASLFVELVLYAWLTQKLAAKVASVVFTAVSVLPLLVVSLAG